MKTILYISDLDYSWPIFHSQVIPHVNELKKTFKVALMVLNRNSQQRVEQDGFFNYQSIQGDYSYYIARFNFFKQKEKIRLLVESSRFDLIYSRGIRGGIVGCFIKRYFYLNHIPLVNDIRGDTIDEHKGNFVVQAILNHLNKKLYNNADLLFLVSSYLKQKICRDYDFNTDNAYVFPTFVPDHKFDFNNNNRTLLRKELDFTTDDIVILYSGNLAKWQNVETILSAFGQTSNIHLRLLILTQDPQIKELTSQYRVPADRIRIKSVPYSDIERYYHAADFGILIRDNTDTNKSASPTKFSEYVNSGLSLIMNSIDADYVKVFKTKKLEGFLLDKKENLLHCLDELSLADVKRNVLKINRLSDVVNGQKEILYAFDSHLLTA